MTTSPALTIPWRWVRTLVTLVVMGVLFPLVTAAHNAPPPAAGLVVDYGDGRIAWAVVRFDGDEIDGVTLLNESGHDVVTISSGALGQAICQIDDTGCPPDECRRRLCQTTDRTSPYWQFHRYDGQGGWATMTTGASGAHVRPGDVYLWAWTGTTPTTPPTSLDAILARLDLPAAPGGVWELVAGELPAPTATLPVTAIAGVTAVIAISTGLVIRQRHAQAPS